MEHFNPNNLKFTGLSHTYSLRTLNISGAPGAYPIYDPEHNELVQYYQAVPHFPLFLLLVPFSWAPPCPLAPEPLQPQEFCCQVLVMRAGGDLSVHLFLGKQSFLFYFSLFATTPPSPAVLSIGATRAVGQGDKPNEEALDTIGAKSPSFHIDHKGVVYPCLRLSKPDCSVLLCELFPRKHLSSSCN